MSTGLWSLEYDAVPGGNLDEASEEAPPRRRRLRSAPSKRTPAAKKSRRVVTRSAQRRLARVRATLPRRDGQGSAATELELDLEEDA